MIVPMTKVTILCIFKDCDATLRALRDLGVLHVSHVLPPEGADVEKARTRLLLIERVLEVLPHTKRTEPSGLGAEAVVEEVDKTIHELNDALEEFRELRAERLQYEPFGSFDPADALALAERGIPVRLFKAGPGAHAPEVEGCQVTPLMKGRTGTWFSVIGQGAVPEDAGEEIPLPKRPLRAMRADMKRVQETIQDCEDHIASFAGDLHAVEALADEAHSELQFREARRGMGSLEPVAYLQGYCPQTEAPRLRDVAQEKGWGLVFRRVRRFEPVPTLIRYPRWVKPIKAVFDFIGILPGYREVDISLFFLLFLTLFFSIIVGDAGYGALFLVTTWMAHRLAPAVMKKPMYPLLMIMSVATMVWGVLAGNYFGLATLPPLLESARVDWLSVDDNMMRLCFLIGAVHLTIAHLWNMWLWWKRPKALAQAGWVCTTWTMYALANTMVLGAPFPTWMFAVLITGLVLVTCFMTPFKTLKKDWMGHAMLPLDLISNFVDVISYVRLFAVGMATYAVAAAFNQMAADIGWHSLWSGLGACFILFVGHGLNILLAAMGVLVHGVRLNTLEFSGHLGLEWTGIPYEPFQQKQRIAS